MLLRFLALAAAAAAAGTVASASAQASRGVAIDLGRVDIEQRLTPGGSYELPVLTVRNPGTEKTSYELNASPVRSDEGDPPPAAWFQFRPSRLTLDPDQTRRVRVRIELPTGAEPGTYVALVGPQILSAGDGAQIGAAASARVSFEVEPASLLQAWWLKAKTFLSDRAPWWYVGLAVVLLIVLARRVRSRFVLRVERRATPGR